MSTTRATLAPLSSLRVSKHQIPRHNHIPNTSIQHKPVIIYHQVFDTRNLTPPLIEDHIQSVGVCEPEWRYSMFSTTHFHSNTHELLVVFRGNAQLLFGGGENPARVEVTVSKGDAILVPAGVGHKLLNQGTEDFEMVGSYPKGADKWDICYGKRGEDVDGKIRNLGWFERDPLYGENGPARNALGG